MVGLNWASPGAVVHGMSIRTSIERTTRMARDHCTFACVSCTPCMHASSSAEQKGWFASDLL